MAGGINARRTLCSSFYWKAHWSLGTMIELRALWSVASPDTAGKLTICVNDYGATGNWRLMTGGWEQIHTGAWRAKHWCICPQWSVISRQSSVIFSSTMGGQLYGRRLSLPAVSGLKAL